MIGILFLVGLAVTAESSSNLGKYCTSKKDCIPVNSDCLNNICQCEKQYYEEQGRCWAKIGSFCKNDCIVKGAECIEYNCTCLGDTYASLDKKSCLFCTQDIGDSCRRDSDCDIKNSCCSSSKTCQCSPNFVENNKQCVPKSLFGEQCIGQQDCACSNNKDCNLDDPYEDLICFKNNCECPNKYHFVQETSSCFPLAGALHEQCANNTSCKNLQNSICINGTCLCAPYCFEQYKQCVKGINATCSGKIDECQVINSICSNKKCQCPKNWHLALNKLSCIEDATVPGDYCDVTADCKKVSNTICSKHLCTCKDNHFEQNKKCLKGIGADCLKTNECSVNNTVCINKLCICKSHMHAENNSCVLNALGDACKEDKDCSDTLFAVCSKNKCTCDKNYTKKHNRCFATEQTKCQANKDCRRPDNFFILEQFDSKLEEVDFESLYHDLVCSKNCSCSAGFHFVSSKFSCVKSVKTLGEVCLLDDHCQLLQNSSCSNNKCNCKEYHFELSETCFAGLGADCIKDEQCKAKNSKCSKGKCVCKPRNIYQSVKQCVPVKSYGEDCESDEQCLCWQASCRVEIPYEDVKCFKGNCSCPIGFHFVPTTYSCIKTSIGIGEQCESNDSCLLLNNAECVANKCNCKENYFVSSGECKQGLKSSCSRDEDCSEVLNARCRENVCQCMEHNVQHSTGLCVEVSNIGEKCQFDEQCSAYTKNSTCKPTTGDTFNGTMTCQCDKAQRPLNNACYRVQLLDEQCDNALDCFLDTFQERVECLNNVCSCKQEYNKISSTYCGGAGSVAASILLTTGVIILKFVLQ